MRKVLSFQRSEMAETVVSFEVPPTSKPIAYSGIAAVIMTDKECDMDRLKTTGILMGWPIVAITVYTMQELYESLKSSSKLFNWSCNVSEKLATILYERSASVRAPLCPLLRVADLAASEVAERVQKRLPVVRQSPSEVYDVMKSGVYNAPNTLWDKVQCLVTRGERRLHKIASSTARTYYKLITALDKWMEKVERDLEESRSKEVKVTRAPGVSSLSQSVETKQGLLVSIAFNWTIGVTLFSVGATAWVVSRLPLVGQLVSRSPSTASSKSTSPTSEKGVKSSSSLYESMPE